MKNLKNVKKLLILIMTIGLIVMFSNFVYAEDEDPFVSLTITNSTENNITSNESNTSNSLFTNINTTNTNTNTTGTLTTNNTTTNNTANNTTNRSVSNTETVLAGCSGKCRTKSDLF